MINYECVIWGKEWIWRNKKCDLIETKWIERNKMTDLAETKGLSKIRSEKRLKLKFRIKK